MQRILTASLVLIIYSSRLFAEQEGNRNIGTKNVIPVSPNAASLGKFGEVPVSYFTGLPNISIPFFSFGTNEMKSSVALSYHAAGLRVSEVPSWTGAGWSINAGGAISRTIRGYADELGQGFFDQAMKLKFLYEHQEDLAYNWQIRNKLIDAGRGEYDTEPDIFYFNFDNASGKFYFNQETGKFYAISKSNLVIKYRPDLDGFTIQTENGNTYYFAEKEFTQVRTYCSVGGPDVPQYGVSSWYLKKVVNRTGTDSIMYEYNNTATSTFKTPNSATAYLHTGTSGNGYFGDFPSPIDQECYSEINVSSRKLSKISFKEGYVILTAITGRCDLIGEKALDKVEFQ